MTIKNLKLTALLWAALLLAGCTRTHGEAGGDSSTHWLVRCGSDDACGGLSCVCGVCSAECSQDDACEALGARASCVPSADGCGALKLCDYECSLPGDCGGGNWTCAEGRCRRRGEGPGLGAVSSDAAAMFMAEEAGFEPMSTRDAGRGAAQDGGSAQMSTSDAGPTQCAPQLAASNGDECAMSRGFSWNGSACEQVVCGCTGADCAALSASKEACEAAFTACRAPETQCSGLPWYRCGDHCPGEWNLMGGGRSFGECAGDCTFTLNLIAPVPAGGGSCLRSRGELHVQSTDGKPERVASFDLTDMAWQEVMLLSRAIEGVPLEPVTGCPDCADGGRAWIVRRNGQSTSGQDVAYEYQRAPLVLRAVDRFVQTLIDQANVCRGDKLQSCQMYREEATAPLPACGDNQPVAASCGACPGVTFEQLGMLNGTPCSESCGACQVPDSTCGAYCVQPCAGGALQWDVYCAE